MAKQRTQPAALVPDPAPAPTARPSASRPRVGDWVHYVARGDTLDAAAGAHRAALVTAVNDADAGDVSLMVFHPFAGDYRIRSVSRDVAATPGTWHLIED